MTPGDPSGGPVGQHNRYAVQDHAKYAPDQPEQEHRSTAGACQTGPTASTQGPDGDRSARHAGSRAVAQYIRAYVPHRAEHKKLLGWR